MTIASTFSPDPAKLVLFEDFHTLDIASPASPNGHRWVPNTVGSVSSVGPNAHFLNHEEEWYGYPGDSGLVGYTYNPTNDTYGTVYPTTKHGPKDLGFNPFTSGSNGLTITASSLKLDPLTCNKPFLSGYLRGAQPQVLGHHSLRCKVPHGQGLWPAFWLTFHGWPPEIDIFEFLGHENRIVHNTVHALSLKTPAHPYSWISQASSIPFDPSADFHNYQFSFDATEMVWYVDTHIELLRLPTPPEIRGALAFTNINLAVGSPKDWPGGPSPLTKFPAVMAVKNYSKWSL